MLSRELLEQRQANWQLVEEVELNELRSLTMEERWQKFISVYSIAHELNLISKKEPDSKKVIWENWNQIRSKSLTTDH